MKIEGRKNAKELYKQLRALSWPALWDDERSRFDSASPDERLRRVALVRAVGVVFIESGREEDKPAVLEWFRGLLQDPEEKIRRYAMAAIPKIGAGAEEEQRLLSALNNATEQREKKYAEQSLSRIGGKAALESGMSGDAEQKIKAAVARLQSPSAIQLDAVASDFSGLRIHLRCRDGLERIVGEEMDDCQKKNGKFRVVDFQRGRVTISPTGPFTIRDIYKMRCFATVGFDLGYARSGSDAENIEALAALIASPLSRRILRSFTEGAIRYRVNFVNKGHQRAAVAAIASRVYAICPEILNDARSVTWTVDIYPDRCGQLVELRPNMTPDLRFSYRQRDVPAASHPPLAACLARLAGRVENDVVWDPFCGSGSELIETAMLGGARRVMGTDLSQEATTIAEGNFAAAKIHGVSTKFICGDFREVARSTAFPSENVSVIITNPPMGMRVPVPDLKRLVSDLFGVTSKVLKPGGRLVFVNPLSMETPHPMLKLQFQQRVDMGGFVGRVEKYLRVAQ